MSPTGATAPIYFYLPCPRFWRNLDNQSSLTDLLPTTQSVPEPVSVSAATQLMMITESFPVPANSHHSNITSGEKITKKSSIKTPQSWQVLFQIKSKWKILSIKCEVHLLFTTQQNLLNLTLTLSRHVSTSHSSWNVTWPTNRMKTLKIFKMWQWRQSKTLRTDK